ncbi:MAG: hypothetical protein RLY40_870 [Pseudomonadota bacterium]|jgi:uncharacterized SAM-binding protein YcdF (DUF218 family)
METWTYEWAVRNLIAQLLMPPGIWLWLILLPLFLLKKRELLQKSLIVFSVLMIWLTSTNYLAVQLTNAFGSIITWSAPLDLKVLESKHNGNQSAQQSGTTNSSKLGAEQAIVILGGGRRSGAIEYPQYQYQNIAAGAMERVRYGVTLSQVTHLPILLTGGAPDATSSNELTEAELTQKVFKNEYQVQARWLEKQSRTTEENAVFSAKILKQEGVTHIYLVTHFWHMPRAKAVFEKHGLKVTPAPMGFYQKDQFHPLDFYPSSAGIERTRFIWREALGLIWYRIKL